MQVAINTTVRPLIVPKPLPSKNNVPLHEAVRLMPGTNEIDDATVKAIKESATARHWVDKGWLQLSEPKKAGEGLEGFEASAAITFIADCMDVSTLERWEETEKRKEVKAVIKKRLKELERALAREPQAEQA